MVFWVVVRVVGFCCEAKLSYHAEKRKRHFADRSVNLLGFSAKASRQYMWSLRVEIVSGKLVVINLVFSCHLKVTRKLYKG